jgi:hypothetical protein
MSIFSRKTKNIPVEDNNVDKNIRIAELIVRISELEKDKSILADKYQDVSTKLKTYEALKERGVVDVFMADPSPVDKENFKLYVAQVAGLYKEILEPKLKFMIAKALLMLEDSTNDREFDQAVKGSVYSLREMMRWGQSMVNTQIAMQTEDSKLQN